MTEQIRNQFREDEVVVLRHWSKERQEYVSNVYPKVGGRLRLAHQNNEKISIETEIYKYDGDVAVVIAKTRTDKGVFFGIGMSSLQRDEKIAPAILEMAESRAVSRCLKIAGYGVEYCSAEEVSHLENGNSKPADNSPPAQNHAYKTSNGGNGNGNDNYKKPAYSKGNGGGNGNNGDNGGSNGGNGGNGGNGNGGGRLSPKQYKFLILLGEEKNVSYEVLNQKSVDTYGVVLEHLTKANASGMIQELQTL